MVISYSLVSCESVVRQLTSNIQAGQVQSVIVEGAGMAILVTTLTVQLIAAITRLRNFSLHVFV